MNKEIINRFLKGDCNNAEIEEVIQWLESVASDDQLGEIIVQDLEEQLTKGVETKKNLDHLLPGIFTSNEQSTSSDSEQKEHRAQRNLTIESREKQSWRFLKWAASVVLVVGLSFMLFFIRRESKQRATVEASIHMITKSNGYGRKSTIFLKDGTIVYLDSDSRITYPSRFTDDARKIILTGEAFFNVAHDETKPFIVKAGPVNIKVLGTEFNVMAFNHAGEVKISLEQGQVEVSNDLNERGISDKLFLSPGQSVIYHLENERFDNIQTFDPLEDCGWKDGIIYFNKAAFKAVVDKLEKWYNVQFEVTNNPPAVWSYSGKFLNQNLDNVLRSIGFSQGFSYKIENDKVVITFKNKDHVSNP
jgi:ferric-dicitrate binding protein FerR (iron transport regulator)